MKKQSKEETQKTQEEFNLTKALPKWRSDRNITSIDRKTYVYQILEEIFELFLSDKKAIDTNKEALYNTWFLHLETNEISDEDFVDVCQDITVFSKNAVALKGYDITKCDEEVYKHISCRKQDPKQKEEWDKHGASGKWKKWEDQPKEELYEPDYKSCKLKSDD